jgi:hypothetical protein
MISSTVPPLLRRRGDDRADLHASLDDDAVERGAHVGVLERDPRVFEGALGPHQLRLGVGHLEPRILVVLLRDEVALAQLLGAPQLRLRVGECCLRDLEVRLGLAQSVARHAGVDLYQELTDANGVAGLHSHLVDLARCLGLDLDGGDRLYDARRARRDHDVPGCHGDQLVYGQLLFLGAPHQRHGDGERRPSD